MKWNEIKTMWQEEGREAGKAEGVFIGVVQAAKKYGATEEQIVKDLVETYHVEEATAKELCKQYM